MLQPPAVCGHWRCGGELFAQLLNDMLGTKLVAIRGYRGSNEITLAIERGELDGFVGAGDERHTLGIESGSSGAICRSVMGLIQPPIIASIAGSRQAFGIG